MQKYIAVYPAGEHTDIVWTSSGRMGLSKARTVRAADSDASAIKLSREPTGAVMDTHGSLWSAAVQLDGRPILLSAEDGARACVRHY